MRRNDSSAAERNGRPVQKIAALPPETLGRLCASLKQQWKRYRKRLKRCQKRFSEKAVHASRVETRRLLSVVELLEPFFSAPLARKIRRALKKYLDTFDELRDTQVQLLLVAELRKNSPAARKFHSHLEKCEARFSKQTRRAIKQVKSGRLAKLVENCRAQVGKHIKETEPELTATMLWRSVNRAFDRVGQLKSRINPRDTRSIHCTRIAFKRFRYMLESLSRCWPVPGKRLLTQMHDYQTLMGNIQDEQVLLQAFDKWDDGTSAARHFRQELIKRRKQLIQHFLEQADQLSEFWPQGQKVAATHGGKEDQLKLKQTPANPERGAHRLSVRRRRELT